MARTPAPGGTVLPPAFAHGRQLTVQQAFALARQHEQAGRLAQAETVLQRILAAQPRNAEALHRLGLLAHRTGRPEQALAFVGRAVDAAPNDARYLTNHTELCRLAGRLEAAVASGSRAVTLAPGSATAHSNLGIACYDAGDYERAETHQREAIRLEPGLAPALNNLGSIARAKDDLDGAIAWYRRAIDAAPDYLEPLNNLGSVLVRAERPAEALAPLEAALERHPDYCDALCNLAFARAALQQHDAALPLFRRALALRPDYAEALQGLGRVHLERREFDAAVAAAEAAVRLQPDSPDTHSTLGQVRTRLSDFQAAEAAYDRALALDPGAAGALVGKGVLYMEAGRLAEAEDLFNAALEAGQETLPARYYLTQVRRVAPGDANVEALAAAANNPDTLPELQATHVHFALGKASEDTGDFDRAFEHFSRGCALRHARGDYDEAALATTFERLRRTLDAERLDALRGHGNPSELPIFVLGMPRSGTTLTEQILASHPDVHGAGELYDLMQIASRSTLEDGATRPFDENLANLDGAHVAAWARDYVTGLQARAPEARRITDKMPANFFLVGLIHVMLPKARIVHVQRDPLDTCVSCFSRLFHHGQEHTYDLRELGRYYQRYHALMAHWRAVLPAGALFDLSYESLVADPAREIPRLIAYCGLPWNDACLAPHEHRRTVRTASVTQVREPVYTTSVSRWRRFERHLGPLVEALGDLAPAPDGRSRS